MRSDRQRLKIDPREVRRRRFGLAMLAGVFAVTGVVAVSVAFVPNEELWTSWWPIAGFGVGVGISSSKRFHILIASLAGLSAGAAIIWNGKPFEAFLGGAVPVGIAVFIAIRFIRRENRRPSLSSSRDLLRLFAGAAIAGIVISVSIFLLSMAAVGWTVAVQLLVRTAPEMTAGILLIAPIFMRIPRVTSTAGRFETVLQWGASLATFAVVFGLTFGLPLAFVCISPLVWAAARLPLRHTFAQILAGAAIVSAFSAAGRGPFSTVFLGLEASTVMVQVYNLTICLVTLSLGVAVTSRTLLADALARSETVTRQNERGELERAAEVQRALLPRDDFPARGFTFAGACIPTRGVGGDFYDWQTTSGGFAITLGDVMGKGVGAGMIAAAMRTAIRVDDQATDAAQAVARASDLLESDLAESSSFVTLFHARVSVSDGAVSFADAGHGLSIVMRPDGSYRRLHSDDLPIGLPVETERTSLSTTMEPGDLLVSVSDGVLDLWDGTLGSIAQIAAIARIAESPQDLVDLIANLASTSETPDDITIIAVQRDL